MERMLLGTVHKSRIAKTFNEILKFNPYHDRLGRFATSNGAASFTYKPGQGSMYDKAIAREKERTASGTPGTTPNTNRKATEKPQKETETPTMKKIHDIEDKIRKQPFESAAVVDNDGNMLYFKDGMQSQVGFTRSECMQMRDNTLTHNHPRCSMFSDADLKCMAYNGLYEIRATNRDGTTYSMKQAAGGYSPSKAIEFAKAYEKEYPNSSKFAQRDLDERGFADKIWKGEVSTVQANIEFGRASAKYMIEWTKKHAPDYGLEFTVETREVKKSYYRGDILKSADADHGKDTDDYFVLDKETNALEDKAFKEWLNRVRKGANENE